jgi:hypothetical protein
MGHISTADDVFNRKSKEDLDRKKRELSELASGALEDFKGYSKAKGEKMPRKRKGILWFMGALLALLLSVNFILANVWLLRFLIKSLI